MPRPARTPLAALCILGLALGCGGPEAPPPAEAPASRSVLLVTIDTLRQDFVSAYGAPWANTPHLDALAERGALFERHYSSMAHTAPAHASLFTGLYAREHGLRRNGGTLDPALPMLAEIFQDSGYHTAAVIGAMVVESRFGFGRGFEQFDEEFPRGAGGTGARRKERKARRVVDRALEFLANAPDDRPLFFWLHFYDPHAPFQAPLRDANSEAEGDERFAALLEPKMQWAPTRQRRTFASYDREVRYTDRELGRFLEAWNERCGDAQITYVTSDHGEGLGEHAYDGHGLHVFEEQLLIPGLLVAPGRIEPRTRVLPTTSAVDTARTLLELAQLPAPAAMGGRSLVRLLDGEGDEHVALALGERRLYSEYDMRQSDDLVERLQALWGPGAHPLGERIAVVRGRWKFIWDEHRAPELYDLSTDPSEHRDLSAERAELVEEFGALIEAWRTNTELRGTGTDASTADDPDVRAQLNALGY